MKASRKTLTDYIYVCRCKCSTLYVAGDLEFLKYTINIEKARLKEKIDGCYDTNCYIAYKS
jgi:hypothetical protein